MPFPRCNRQNSKRFKEPIFMIFHIHICNNYSHNKAQFDEKSYALLFLFICYMIYSIYWWLSKGHLIEEYYKFHSCMTNRMPKWIQLACMYGIVQYFCHQSVPVVWPLSYCFFLLHAATDTWPFSALTAAVSVWREKACAASRSTWAPRACGLGKFRPFF